jgi:hypothetical protein
MQKPQILFGVSIGCTSDTRLGKVNSGYLSLGHQPSQMISDGAFSAAYVQNRQDLFRIRQIFYVVP